MFNTLTFNGVNLFTRFGVYISGQGTFSAPSRQYTFYDVPARDGSVLGIGTKLNNIEVSYKAGIVRNFSENIKNLRSFLLSSIGYCRLADTYHPDEYRQAIYEGDFDPDVTSDNEAAEFTLTFNCMPQRFLTSGETAQTFTANGTLANPTHFDAKPLLLVSGSGYFSIASGGKGVQVNLSQSMTDLYIDCETMNVYKGSTNYASVVSFQEYGASRYGVDAPVLKPGTNNIRLSNISKLVITPRWWEV